jgi:hypothetical protein
MDRLTPAERQAREERLDRLHQAVVEQDGDPRVVKVNRRDVAEVLAELDRLHTWDGLMWLLDQHWPAWVFPPGDSPQEAADERLDVGHRVVALIRWVDRLRQEQAP